MGSDEGGLAADPPAGCRCTTASSRTGGMAASDHHLGNFPQVFTNLSLINAVVSVIEAEHAGDGG